MSAPYLVLIWPPEAGDPQSQAQLASELSRDGWVSSRRRDRMEVWVRPERRAAVVWCEPYGALCVGQVLERSPAPAIPPGAEVAERARALCAGVWGGYVALLHDARAQSTWALRDPSASLEAFAWRRGDLQILASSLAGLPRSLWPSRLALDWDVVADHVARPTSISARSALSGVQALTPGTLHLLADPEVSRAIWRPSHWLPQDAEVAPDIAERLAETICSAVGALTGGQARILCEASGGLDSAIIAAALVASGGASRISGLLNYQGDRPESEESRWARLLAERWGLPLQIGLRDLSPFDPQQDFAPLADDVRPPVSALDAWRDRDTAERLTGAGATALVTGMGGDAALFQMPTPLVVADLWRARRLSAVRDPLVAEVARWLRRSIWSVGREALGWRAPSAAPGAAFLGPRAREPAQRAEHPWLEDLATASPGKRLQIEGLAALHRAQGRNRRAMAAEVIHPLMSQPVMELCLSIPSWVHVRGGRDRGLAREAFRPLLPAEVVERRSKGGLTSLFSRRVAASLDVLRPHLLDGALADAGVLDRRAMEIALDADRLLWRADGLDLIMAAAVESWVRHWQRYVPDSAAAPRRPTWGS